MSRTAKTMTDRRGRAYTPAIGPRLKPFLWVVLIGFALLGANGVYLASISSLTYFRGIAAQTPFYMLMVAFHLFFGFVLILPFLIFGFVHLATSWKRPNRAAVRFGLLLFASPLVVLVPGLVVLRVGLFAGRLPPRRSVCHWLSLGTPPFAIALSIPRP